jgi:hypothetical protein
VRQREANGVEACKTWPRLGCPAGPVSSCRD